MPLDCQVTLSLSRHNTSYWRQTHSRVAFYRPRAFSIALIIILFASSPERFATVKCAIDSRRRIFVLASMEISVICIATRGVLRLIIVISASFFLAKISPQKMFACWRLKRCGSVPAELESCHRHGFIMFSLISLCEKHGNKKETTA